MKNAIFLWPQVIFARHTLTMTGGTGASQRGARQPPADSAPGAGGRQEAGGPCALRPGHGPRLALGTPGTETRGTAVLKWQNRDRHQT